MIDEDKARELVHIGEQLEDMLNHPGWQIVMDKFIAKGLDRQRFLGCRIGKLAWQQGFQSALDGLLRFIQHGIDEKNKIVTST